MPPEDDPITAPGVGARLAQFRLRRELGRGGAGVVYEAEDTLLHRPVAVKVLRFDADDAEGRRALREARAVARLDHPHVVRIHHVGKWAGGFYLVLELMPGGSLDPHVRAGRPLPWGTATAAVADAARGLAAAHDAGLVHRDVKPANLLTDKSGRVKVSDFGLVRAVEGADPALSHALPGRMTFAGSMRSLYAGTPRYMSPEQCRGEPADERSDVYSLGITYYALLTGRPPFDAATPTQLMFAHCTTPMPDPRELVPDVPAGCAEAVRRATAKSPAERFQSAAEFLAALPAEPDARQAGDSNETGRGGLPTVRRPRPVSDDDPTGDPEQTRDYQPEPTRRFTRRPAARTSRRAVLLAAGGVGLAAVGGLALWQFGPWRPKAVPPAAAEREWAAPSAVAAVAVSVTGKWVAAGGSGGVTVWDTGTGALKTRLDWGPTFGLVFRRANRPWEPQTDDSQLIGGGPGGPMTWFAEVGQDGAFIPDMAGQWGDNGTLRAAAIKGGEWVALGYTGGRQHGKVKQYENNNTAADCIGGAGVVGLSYAVRPADDRLAVLDADGRVSLFQFRSGTHINWPNSPKASAVAFVGGSILATADGSRVRFWLADYVEEFTPLTRPAVVTTLAASADGKWLAVGHADGTVLLVGVAGRPAPGPPWQGHAGAVRSAAFSLDGRSLVTADDATVRLWDVTTRGTRTPGGGS